MRVQDFVAYAKQRMAGTDVPLWLAVGWASVESGFHETQVESSVFLDGERGLFQISGDESNDYGFNHERLSTDDVAYQFDCWLTLVGRYGDSVASGGLFRGTDTYWRTIKLCHGQGIGATKALLASMRKAGTLDLNDWNDISRAGHATSNSHWIDNAQMVYTVGVTTANQYRESGDFFFLKATRSLFKTIRRFFSSASA